LSVSKDFLLAALLQENFLPLQKKKKDELPPVFNSSGLTKKVATDIRNISLSKERKKVALILFSIGQLGSIMCLVC
jgi:hypothetical protein